MSEFFDVPPEDAPHIQEPLAALPDFEARHGDVPELEQDKVGTLLADATELILDTAEGSDADWVLGEEGAAVPAKVVAVCVAVAYRAWTNPNALARQALGQASYVFRGDVPDAIYLTDREARIIRKASARSTFRAVTLESPYSGPTLDDNELPL